MANSTAHSTVALFGKAEDKQLQAVARAVREAGVEPAILPILLDRRDAPALRYTDSAFGWGDGAMEAVRSVFIRGHAYNTLPTLPPMLHRRSFHEWQLAFLTEEEYQAASYGFFHGLRESGCLVVNPPETYVHHDSKAQFYMNLIREGYPAPETICTNDPEVARAFVSDRGGKAVIKPGIGVGSTRLIREPDLARIHEVAASPVLLQEYIQGTTCRVHVVGDRVVLALRILGDEIDSRTNPQGFEYVKLPDAEEERLAAATNGLGLEFAAWDVLLGDDGRMAYLDCNPGPYMMWIGKDNVRAICRSLARLLVTYAETDSLARARAAVAPVPPPA